jgi:hypothetical protein
MKPWLFPILGFPRMGSAARSRPGHRIAELLPESRQRLKDAGELPPISAG